MRVGKRFEPWKVSVETNGRGQAHRIEIIDSKTAKSTIVDEGRITFGETRIEGGSQLAVGRSYAFDADRDRGNLVSVSAAFSGNGGRVNRAYHSFAPDGTPEIIDTGFWDPKSENPLNTLSRTLTGNPMLGEIPETFPRYYEETLRILERAGVLDFATQTRQYFRMVFTSALHLDQMSRRASRAG